MSKKKISVEVEAEEADQIVKAIDDAEAAFGNPVVEPTVEDEADPTVEPVAPVETPTDLPVVEPTPADPTVEPTLPVEPTPEPPVAPDPLTPAVDPTPTTNPENPTPLTPVDPAAPTDTVSPTELPDEVIFDAKTTQEQPTVPSQETYYVYNDKHEFVKFYTVLEYGADAYKWAKQHALDLLGTVR